MQQSHRPLTHARTRTKKRWKTKELTFGFLVGGHCACGPLIRSAFENVPAEESAGQGQKCFMDVGSFLIANAQAAKLAQPSEGSLNHPAPSA